MFVLIYNKFTADDKWHEEGYFSTWEQLVSFVEKEGIANDVVRAEWVLMSEINPTTDPRSVQTLSFVDDGPVW